MSRDHEFRRFAATVRETTEATIDAFFERKRAQTHALSPTSVELVDAIAALTLRGGKRLRPVVAAAAMVAIDADVPLERIGTLGASLELLQTYLLAHDDLMDGDLERRGGPSLHASFRGRHGERRGDALGLLGGDLASAHALELLLDAPFPEATRTQALAAFVRMREEVYVGQHLDLVGSADVARIHDLKTGSYTVRGPAMLGALLAGADAAQLRALRSWADPLGHAFQLADDRLGTFGETRETGKPGDDLRRGNRNAVVEEAERRLGTGDRPRFDAVFGRPDADADAVRALVDRLRALGVPDAIDARIEALLARSEHALTDAALSPRGKELLTSVGHGLARRSH